jgi:peptidoglycan-N-acetylglucosamine deacetylase
MLCAISVDLDEIHNYSSIHGLGAGAIDSGAVYDVGVDRLGQWAKNNDVPLTLFAVASDLRRKQAAGELKRMAAAGHEIANHSLEHPYDLTRLTKEEMRRQVWGAADMIEREVGVRPVGFRAPGYVTTDTLYEVLGEQPLSYSSSVFPCPWYYGAKAAAIVGKRLFGRRSSSLIDDPRVLSAPIRPYRVGTPYWKQGHGVLELPIQVTPWARLPFIGTSLVAAGPGFAERLCRSLVGSPLINLELHGIDVLEAADGLQGLAAHQPDLRIGLARKLATLDRVVYTLGNAGYRFCTLAHAAQEVGI